VKSKLCICLFEGFLTYDCVDFHAEIRKEELKIIEESKKRDAVIKEPEISYEKRENNLVALLQKKLGDCKEQTFVKIATFAYEINLTSLASRVC